MQRHTNSHLNVRRATPEDAHHVQQMVEEIATEEGNLHAVHTTVAHWREMLTQPDVTVLIVTDGDIPLGYLSAVRQLNLWQSRPIIALDDLYVRPGARNLGAGAKLMHSVARMAAVDDLLIRWEVNEDNHAAQRFYARLGATLRTKVIATWTPEQYRNGTPTNPGIAHHTR